MNVDKIRTQIGQIKKIIKEDKEQDERKIKKLESHLKSIYDEILSLNKTAKRIKGGGRLTKPLKKKKPKRKIKRKSKKSRKKLRKK